MSIRLINDGPGALEGESFLLELIAAGAPPPVLVVTLTQEAVSAGTMLLIIRSDVLVAAAFQKAPVFPVAAPGVQGTPGNWILAKGFYEIDVQGKVGDTFNLRLEAGNPANITVILNYFTDVPASGRRSSGGL